MSRTASVAPVGAVGALTDMIRTACIDLDTTRALPASVVDALRDAGVFRLLAPADVGGHEVDPVTFLEVVEAASYADGSVGWCVMIGGCYATFGGMLPMEAAREIYGDPNTISAGAFRPEGFAAEVEGGYRVSGRWQLGSGSSHATWYVGGCIVLRDGEPVTGPSGMPMIREVFFPASETEVIDTWDSTGLRGTASHDYATTDTFVPHTHACWFQDPPRLDGPLYQMPPVAMFATFIGAVPLGIARHALDEFVALADAKTATLATTPIAEKGVVQERLGRAHALVAAGRGYLIQTLGELWAKVQDGHAPTMADRGTLWLAATHAAHSALKAIGLLYTAAGASSVYARSPLDRCLRDARTSVQHITTQETNYELAGRLLLGRPVLPSPWMLDYRGEAGMPEDALQG